MSILVPVSKNTNTENLPDGTYPAVLFRMVQIGTITETFKNQPRAVKKILFSFVIPSMTRSLKEMIVPYIVHKEYTESLFGASHLRRDMIALSGRDMFSEDAQNGTPYDLEDLLGAVGLITTRHLKLSDGKTIVDISGFEPLPEDDIYPDNPLPFQSLNFADFDWKLYNALAERLRRRIAGSREYQAFPAELRRAGLAGELDRQPEPMYIGEDALMD